MSEELEKKIGDQLVNYRTLDTDDKFVLNIHIGHIMSLIKQERIRYGEEILVRIGSALESDKGKEYRFFIERIVEKDFGLSTYKDFYNELRQRNKGEIDA